MLPVHAIGQIRGRRHSAPWHGNGSKILVENLSAITTDIDPAEIRGQDVRNANAVHVGRLLRGRPRLAWPYVYAQLLLLLLLLLIPIAARGDDEATVQFLVIKPRVGRLLLRWLLLKLLML